jgi:hypothetical protein
VAVTPHAGADAVVRCTMSQLSTVPSSTRRPDETEPPARKVGALAQRPAVVMGDTREPAELSRGPATLGRRTRTDVGRWRVRDGYPLPPLRRRA